MPEPQRLLLEALGPEWVAELRFPWGPKGIPAWVVDLAHRELQIAVEVDGGSHRPASARARDRRKEEFLNALGWRVFRVPNGDIRRNLSGVLESITTRYPELIRTSLKAG
jgi:very-short-patch-repair endonuclease